MVMQLHPRRRLPFFLLPPLLLLLLLLPCCCPLAAAQPAFVGLNDAGDLALRAPPDREVVIDGRTVEQHVTRVLAERFDAMLDEALKRQFGQCLATLRVPSVRWVSFDGTTGTIMGSAGVSKVTITDAGLYRLEFDPPFPDDRYAVAASCAFMGSRAMHVNVATPVAANLKAGSLVVATREGSGGKVLSSQSNWVTVMAMATNSTPSCQLYALHTERLPFVYMAFRQAKDIVTSSSQVTVTSGYQGGVTSNSAFLVEWTLPFNSSNFVLVGTAEDHAQATRFTLEKNSDMTSSSVAVAARVLSTNTPNVLSTSAIMLDNNFALPGAVVKWAVFTPAGVLTASGMNASKSATGIYKLAFSPAFNSTSYSVWCTANALSTQGEHCGLGDPTARSASQALIEVRRDTGELSEYSPGTVYVTVLAIGH